MLRTQISLTVQERRVLDAAAARTGRSVAALIRDAVDTVYGVGQTVEEDISSMRAAFGAWQGPGRDGTEWVEGLRSGRRLEDTA